MKKTIAITTLTAAGLFVASLELRATQGASRPAGMPGIGELGGPARRLRPEEMQQFLRGRALFDKSFDQQDGLGTPDYNADSCRACHQDPAMGGAGSLELNVSRFAFDNDGDGPFENVEGGQLLHKFRGPWMGGDREEYEATSADVFEQRQTPSIFGDGLIDSIPDAEILSNEDPTDRDRDGIMGYARRIDVGGRQEIGRFGWKAQIPRLADFVNDAMAGECGITTPDNGRGFNLSSDSDPVGDPELNQKEVDQVAFFMQMLAAPMRAGSQEPEVLAGERLFESVGCARCHIPVLQGEQRPVPLYSDLLLHNVMEPGYRGMAEAGAPAGWFRTPPLWGIRHSAPYMHDGRAEDLEQAILFHSGEAAGSRAAYQGLGSSEQAALIAFLLDL